eukprot:Blabericola_migrator_1__13391@NODE_955_length_5901_cov_91_229345_g663_i0_p2_GENE_NODE_955_length_5901_cov_91_229345_g663_i0NODE_955_length_5901_cov_91_229345_g663_i0_p2_ORF_typecomplete_len343_score44_572Hacid_dh_C/PF02826_19/1_4e032Hacid_dh_C/PF02826_19/1_9e472Hacid_dh/PF00389_30/1_4e28AlaDh_PNT_C/PF01262_21/8_2e06AdoHcyase_NAD/PF00670_21/4_4e05Shikimate_DH/PF01488_20/0_00019THF_DHG_CYH_C/PF02882_19/0_001Pyr_redox_2/PF07992_14/0_0023Pyr_redox/PF00070_27/0_0076PglD_N/PF17836_1/0_019Ldh_1_N/PF000
MESAVTTWIKAKPTLQHRAEATPEPPNNLPIIPAPGPISFYSPDDTICDEFIAAIHSAGGQICELSPETRGLIWQAPLDAEKAVEVLTACPNIQWVQLPMAGIGHDFIRRANCRPLVWTCAKGAYAEPVAEHAVVLAQAALRLLKQRATATSWADSEIGRSLYGLKVLIVGAGGIGLEVARLMAPYRTQIAFVRKRATPVPGGYPVVPMQDLDEVLPAADVIVLCAPLTDDSYRMINRSRLELMKNNAVIVNVGRGGLVDTEALINVLRARPAMAAGLDVTDPEPLPDDSPLWSLPNCLVTPHSADTAEMCVPLLAERIHSNVKALLGRGPFRGVVDVSRGY